MKPTEHTIHRAALLGELWEHLKLLDEQCTEAMKVALVSRALDNIGGQRTMVREIQSWLLAHGYSPNTYFTADKRQNK